VGQEGFKVFGRGTVKSAAEEFLFDRFDPDIEMSQFLLVRKLESLIAGKVRGCFLRLDFGVALSAPGNQGRFGYANLGSDAVEAEALEAEFQEFISCIG